MQMKEKEEMVNHPAELNMTLANSLVDLQMKQSRQELEVKKTEWKHRIMWIAFGCVLVAVIAVVLMIISYYKHREYRSRIRLSEVRMNELTETISLIRHEKVDEVERIHQSLLQNRLVSNDDNSHFILEFEKTYPAFVRQLASFPEKLGKREKILCMLTVLKLSTDSIAEYMGISTASVRMLRYRIRKKVQLDKDQSLDEVLQAMFQQKADAPSD